MRNSTMSVRVRKNLQKEQRAIYGYYFNNRVDMRCVTLIRNIYQKHLQASEQWFSETKQNITIFLFI